MMMMMMHPFWKWGWGCVEHQGPQIPSVAEKLWNGKKNFLRFPSRHFRGSRRGSLLPDIPFTLFWEHRWKSQKQTPKIYCWHLLCRHFCWRKLRGVEWFFILLRVSPPAHESPSERQNRAYRTIEFCNWLFSGATDWLPAKIVCCSVPMTHAMRENIWCFGPHALCFVYIMPAVSLCNIHDI